MSLSQITEEEFEQDHELKMYAHLRNKLIKQFADVFKEDLGPENRLDVPPVRITLKPGHEDVPLYNARVPIATPRYLEKAADLELSRILKSGVLEDVTWPTRSACRAFFVQKPGSPDSDPEVRLVNNMKPINPHIESPEYPMDTSKKILESLNPEEVCYGVIDLVQGFHQVPVHEDSRDLLTVILPQGKFRFKSLPQGLVCSTDYFNLCSDPLIRNQEGFRKNVDDILTRQAAGRKIEEVAYNMQKQEYENCS